MFKKVVHKFFRGTPILASLSSLGSAGVTACTGGVCSVAAQGGSALLAGTSTSMAGITGLASGATALPSWMATPAVGPAITSPSLPIWLKLVILALMASVCLTVYGLAGKPKWATMATLAGVLCITADLGWLPGGVAGMNAGLGLGIPVLVLSPWLARTGPKKWVRWFRILLMAGSVLASITTLYLQFGMGWIPCMDCWGERLFLWTFTIFGSVVLIYSAIRSTKIPNWNFKILAGLALGGFGVSYLQLLEVVHSQIAEKLVAVCGSVGPSCVQAGSQLFLGFPIVYFSLTLFAGLFTGSLIAGLKTTPTVK